jgi:hypothetical protein
MAQNRPVEAREHIRRFHELFFTLNGGCILNFFSVIILHHDFLHTFAKPKKTI